MSLFLHMFGKPPKNQEFPSTSDIRERKKLQKPRTLNASRKSANPDTDFFDVFRAQSCLILQSEDEKTPVVEKTEHLPHIGTLLSESPSLSHNSTSLHSTSEKMAPARVPRRAKTPVMFVGQLESSPLPYEPAQAFAQQYSAILPPRTFTPCVEEELVKPQRRSIRKIKCQQSLRDLVKEQSRPGSSSDCDTLVGSESPTSPISPMQKNFPEVSRLQLIDKPPPRPQSLSKKASLDMINELHDEIGLGICMNLLTNELATALFKQHPSENQDRASGLQIRLMIEAYETLQQHVRKELYDAHVNGLEVDSHVQEIEVILERWLDSLYTVYNIAQEKKPSCEVIKEVDEEYDWPLRRSEESGRTYVSC
jgi:hypothetical protein